MSSTIERYFNHECLTPALKAIGQSRQIAARSDLLPHHEQYFEIHLIMDGSLHWWVENETYQLSSGSVYLTKPNELHGAIKNTVQPCTLTWLQVDANELKDSSLSLDLYALEEHTWLGAHELIADATAMLSEIRNPQEDSARFVESQLRLFLAKLLRQYKNRQQEPQYPEQLKSLLEFIDLKLELEEVIQVEDLAAFVGLSRSRVFQLFSQHLGQSPMSYLNSQRIELAKQSLRQADMTITQLAMNLGYASSQHFATSFKRMTGMTPKEYRKLRSLEPEVEQRLLGKEKAFGHG